LALIHRKGDFKAHNIVQWTDVPEGKMCQMLRDGDRYSNTNGRYCKDIVAGNQQIVQVYVQSPLIWGIHVAAGSNTKHFLI
jgi:hypothetical protein